MTVGGGFTGIVITAQSLFNSSGLSALNLALMVGFIGLYVFVTASGLIFVHDPTRTGPLFVALAIQIPELSSSVIVYKFVAGLEASFGVRWLENKGATSLNFDWVLQLGCRARVVFFQENPLRIGVNFAALACLILLSLALRPASSLTAPNTIPRGVPS